VILGTLSDYFCLNVKEFNKVMPKVNYIHHLQRALHLACQKLATETDTEEKLYQDFIKQAKEQLKGEETLKQTQSPRN
jgi:hypothetical protein